MTHSDSKKETGRESVGEKGKEGERWQERRGGKAW